LTTAVQHEDAVGTAALAKAALRLLAERRLLPTPENYEQAWRRVSGTLRGTDPETQGARPGTAPRTAQGLSSHRTERGGAEAGAAGPAGQGVQAAAGHNAPPPWFVEGLLTQLCDLRLLRQRDVEAVRQVIGSDWVQAGQRLNAALADRASNSWGPLLSQLQNGFAVRHHGWTLVRKREAVMHVIEAAGKRDDLLYSRLHALIASWQQESTVDAVESGAGPEGALAVLPAPDAVDEKPGLDVSAAPGRRRCDERLIAEMSALLTTLCDNLDGMTEQTSWMRGQVDVLRDSLQHPDDSRRLGEIRRSIAQSADSQRRLQVARRDSVDELKRMISTWIGSVGALSHSTGAFGDRIDAHVESISGIESIDQLSETVREILADTQAMSRQIQSSHDEMAAMRSRALALEHEVSRLEDELASASTQIITDHLTSTMNRRGLEQAFGGAQSRAGEFRSPLALAVLDVDDFKRVNDTYGHKGGDDALQQLARIFKLKLRSSDAVARFGGEEFVLLLPDLDVDAAVAHVMRLQREVTSHVFLSDDKHIFITFSAGVTLVTPSDTLTGAVERADEAMYAAKRAGKNCVRSV